MEMLSNVEAWQPPTEKHSGLKNFMIKQIKESIDYDCSTKYLLDNMPKPKPPDEWYSSKVEKFLHDIDYHNTEHQKEVARCQGNTDWVNKLRESLK